MSDKVYNAICDALRYAKGFDHYRNVITLTVNGRQTKWLVSVIKHNSTYTVSVAQYDVI